MTSVACPFCEIVHGHSDAHVVARTAHTVAFLDIRPVFKGHTLVVPTDHIATLPDLPDELLAPLLAEVRRVAAVMPDALDAHGTFVATNNVVSQSVAHLHVHVIPRRRKDGLRGFFWPRQRYEPGEADHYAARLAVALA